MFSNGPPVFVSEGCFLYKDFVYFNCESEGMVVTGYRDDIGYSNLLKNK